MSSRVIGVVRGGVVCAVLAVCGTSLGAQQTVVLTDGDRLSGRVTRIEAGRWVFRFGNGEAKIPPRQIAAFTAPEPIGVRFADSTIAVVTLQPSDDLLRATFLDGSTRLVTPAEIEAIGSPDDLEALRPIRIGIFSPLWMFWGASGSVGFSDQSGNSRARGIAGELEIQRRSPRDRITLGGGINREFRENDDGDLVTAVAKYYGSLRFDLYFLPRFFAFAATLQERDRFQDLDLRSNYTAGFGFQFIGTRTTEMRLSVSSGIRVENFLDNGRTTAAVLNSSGDVKEKLGPLMFDWKIAWTPNIQDLGDFRARSNATLTAAVYAGLGFRIGLLNEYNSRPRPGVEKHDMLFTTTLAYTVGALR